MADTTEDGRPYAFGFKKKKRPQQARKRRASGSDASSEDETKIVKVGKRPMFTSHLVQKSGAPKNKEELAQVSSEEEGAKAESKVGMSYKSTGTTDRNGPQDMGATATYELDTELDKDAQAIYQRSLDMNKELKDKEDDKVYRGMNNYAQYIEKRDTAAGNAASGSVRRGPVRAPANLRATVRWDYQPDICKDYKETGFCGFGDSCKFLHDRSDYKHGWQLEREAERGEYGDTEDMTKYEISSDEDELPFKCYICKDSFKNPIITKCKHYFCETCALKQYKKSKRCFVCNEQTMGVFNPAKELIAKMEKSKSKAAAPSNSDSDDDDKEDGIEIS